MEAIRDLAGASDDDDGDDDNDDAFDEDMEALRRACMITGADPDLLGAGAGEEESNSLGDGENEDKDDGDDDFALLQNLRNRFGIASDAFEPRMLMPLCSLPPDCSDVEDSDADDFETLRAIQKRFAAYDNDSSVEKESVRGPSVSSETKSSDDLHINRAGICEESGSQSASGECNPVDSSKPSTSQANYSNFPKSANLFMDAIKKNRSFQKFLRDKLIQVEAKIEGNKKLMERVKILKDFQVNCKKRTGRALSLKKDSRVQLISGRKTWPIKDCKVLDRKMPAMYYGPQENSHVKNFRMALSKFPLSLDRKKWSDAERKNIEKGIKQQFQEMVLESMVDQPCDAGESGEEVNDLDSLLISIKDLNVTPEDMKLFLPKVNWERVASIYVAGRSGAECETRWLNFEDPLINRNPWTAQEDKTLLFNVQNKGLSNWFDISVTLGTNRTPFQCLSRYQRSLNVSILKSEWTKDEDAKLRFSVEAFGEHNWQDVAASLEGWTGTQCSNRWKKSLHPGREKVGRWTKDEDKRLTVAQMLFGPKNWKKTACFVPGRTEVQCRERWVNSLDPSLNWEKWTEEEDSKLREAILEHGYCWTKVATALPRRTDNMCRRRWKRLNPHELQYLQAARKVQKSALICNFVDRESERPAIGPNDFCPLPLLTTNGNVNGSNEETEILRIESGKKQRKSPCKVKKTRNPKKSKESTQTASEALLMITNNDKTEVSDRRDQETELKGRSKKRPRKLQCEKAQLAEINGESKNDKVKHVGESSASKFAQNGTSSWGPKNRNRRTKKPKEQRNIIEPTRVFEKVVLVPVGDEPNGTSGLYQNDIPANTKANKSKLQVETLNPADMTSSSRQENGLRSSSTEDCHVARGNDQNPGLGSQERDGEEDDMNLACFLQTVSKKRCLNTVKSVDKTAELNGLRSSSTEDCHVARGNDQNPGLGSQERDGEEDDMNLACFMQTVSKKRRLNTVKSGDKMAELRRVLEIKQPTNNKATKSKLQNGFKSVKPSLEDHQDARERPNSMENDSRSSSFLDELNDRSDDQNHDRVAGPGSPKTVGEEDGMTLACFMLSISKKRRLNPVKEGDETAGV